MTVAKKDGDDSSSSTRSEGLRADSTEENRTIKDHWSTGETSDLPVPAEIRTQESVSTSSGQDQTESSLGLEEKSILQQAASRQSVEEQRKEFESADAIFAEASKDHAQKDFIDFTRPQDEQFSAVSNNPLMEAIVQAEDGLPFVAAAPAPEPEKKKTLVHKLIGRTKDIVSGKLPISQGSADERTKKVVKFVGPTVLVAVAVALFIVPAIVKAKAENRYASEIRHQMKPFVEQEIDDSLPYAQTEELVKAKPRNNTTSGAPGVGATSSTSNDLLMEARSLAHHGRAKDACELYEAYLEENQDSVSVRVELIKLYMTLKNHQRARWHCLRGIKSDKCSDADRATLWNLMRESMNSY
jgi:hypothetical protein